MEKLEAVSNVIAVDVVYDVPGSPELPAPVKGYVEPGELTALMEAVANGTSFQGRLLAFPKGAKVLVVKVIDPTYAMSRPETRASRGA